MEDIQKTYNSDLLKGTGLIPETLLLLDVYEPGITKPELTEKVLELNSLGKEHENRTKDIIHHTFNRRYLIEGEETVISLKSLREKYVSLEIISQILFIYTCRANDILFDFVKDVYQKCVAQGEIHLPSRATLKFIEESIRNGRIPKKWADTTKRKVSEHMTACLIDFKLIDRSKNILPFFIHDFTMNYWMHALHFKGKSDKAILLADEWSLFGLFEQEVLSIMQRLSYAGHFIFQNSGELIKITWKYKNMNEFINGAA